MRSLRFLLLIAALFYLVFIFRTAFPVGGQTWFTLVDDAMISMRYARNLAQGHGLVWNVGQPPIEGFTNLGWTLLLAVFHLFPFSPAHISLAVMVLAAGLLLCNVAVVHRIARELVPSAEAAPLIAAAASAFYFPLVYWTLRGLETGALTLCLSLAVLFALRAGRPNARPGDHWGLALALAGAILIRMDAALPAGLILLYLAGRSPRAALIPALAAVLTLGAILLFQKTYFGDFLPNTYYLKVNGVTAWERVRIGLLGLSDYAWRDIGLPLFATAVGLAAFRSLRTREVALLLSFFAAQVAYSVWVGGDFAEDLVDSANRFIAQGMPALILLFSLVMDEFLKRAQGVQVRPWAAALIGLGAVLVMSGEPWARWTYTNAPMLRTDIQRARLGLHIQQHTDPEAVIAVHAAGQIPYYSERTIIDLLGKNDRVIAQGPPAAAFTPGHNKWNYEYSILELKPDVVADNFNKLRGFMQDQTFYIELPNGIYVRSDTALVDRTSLGGDY